MTWTLRSLLRLALSCSLRKVSDQARLAARTTHDGARRGALLVEEIALLLSQAEHSLDLAVAFARMQGTSWEAIGDLLGLSPAAAEQRFKDRVDAIYDRVFFPEREAHDGARYSAGLGGLYDPDHVAAELDDWLLRHREPHEPDRSDRPFTGSVVESAKSPKAEAVLDATMAVRQATRGQLPDGVSHGAALKAVTS